MLVPVQRAVNCKEGRQAIAHPGFQAAKGSGGRWNHLVLVRWALNLVSNGVWPETLFDARQHDFLPNADDYRGTDGKNELDDDCKTEGVVARGVLSESD